MKTVLKHRLRSLIILAILMGVTVAGQMFVSGNAFRNDVMTVWVFDVGQGDAIFIDAPEAQILIDGGPNGIVVEKLSSVMPFWDRSIDVLVNTHPHADHVTGLVHVLERYHVGEVWTSGQSYTTGVFGYFEDLIFGVERHVQAGEVLHLGVGATLTVLWPDEDFDGEHLENVHDANVTLLFEYGETSMLLTGDMEADVEHELLMDLQHVDVLKVGHAGSLTSTSVELLRDTSPDYAVIPVGENDYGHPHPVIVNRLHEFGVTVLRSDVDGDVRFTTNGNEWQVTLFDL